MEYKKHISGLKGFACFMVMLGHFLAVLGFAQEFPDDIHYLTVLQDSKFGFSINASFWLYLFFVVSGYLLSFSQIDKLTKLLSKCLQRFLRLGLPILFAYIIIYLIYKTVGFHNSETTVLFQNSWYQEFFTGNYTLLTVLFSPIDVLILGKCYLNNPYWVLRDMFIASLIIYVLNYSLSVLPNWKHRRIIKLIIIALVLIITWSVSTIIFSCCLGSVIGWSEKSIKRLVKEQAFYVGIIIASLLILIFPDCAKQVFFATLIICVPKIKCLDKIFSSKLCNFFGRISFGIYSFHWPLFCSAGALIMLTMHQKLGLLYSVIIAILVMISVTILLSWLYNITFEKLSSFITKKVLTI